MSLPIFRRASFVALLALTGCGSGGGNDVDPAAERITCALDGASNYATDCTVERSGGKDGLVLTIGRQDKGYRRFIVPTDGRGLVVADGAEAAKVTIIGDNQVEVSIGRDRYRLPATIKQGQ